jgi:hypothetical protein
MELSSQLQVPVVLTPGKEILLPAGWKVGEKMPLRVETQSSSLEPCHYSNGFKLKTGNNALMPNAFNVCERTFSIKPIYLTP